MSFFLEFAESKRQKNKCPFLFSSDHGCSSSFCHFFFLKKILLCEHESYFTYSKCPFSIQVGVFGFFLSFFLFIWNMVENKRVLNSSQILFFLSPDSKMVWIIKIGWKLRKLWNFFLRINLLRLMGVGRWALGVRGLGRWAFN